MSDAIIGVSDHSGWAVLVTATSDGTLLDRRRVELIASGLPKLPHHHEAQKLPLEDALNLIERVRMSAERHATLALEALAIAVSSRIQGIAIRECPPLPPTIAERLTNYRAQNVADTVMYRMALAGAAEARGWAVHWYQRKKVLDTARDALHVADLDAYSLDVRKSIGPPWTNDHKVAMAAAVVAASDRHS
jgi:hypothetical protein